MTNADRYYLNQDYLAEVRQKFSIFFLLKNF